MSSRLARHFETDPAAAPVVGDLRAFVRLAVRVTRYPGEVGTAEVTADVAAAVAAAHEYRQYLDAVGVMFAFNFITRIANSLDVVPEIPRWMHGHEFLRRSALSLMALGLRLFVDLRPRRIPGPSVNEHWVGLQALCDDIGFGPLPEWLAVLKQAPPILATVHECFEAHVRRGKAPPEIAIVPAEFKEIAKAALESFPDEPGALRNRVEAWCLDPPPASQRMDLLIQFARDVATQSSPIRQDRIEELRRAKFDDAEILDVAIAASLWSAMGRLEILCTGLADPVALCDNVL